MVGISLSSSTTSATRTLFGADSTRDGESCRSLFWVDAPFLVGATLGVGITFRVRVAFGVGFAMTTSALALPLFLGVGVAVTSSTSPASDPKDLAMITSELGRG